MLKAGFESEKEKILEGIEEVETTQRKTCDVRRVMMRARRADPAGPLPGPRGRSPVRRDS